MNQSTMAIVVILSGLVLVPVLANWQPELINGLLILLLVGVILGNYKRWLPWITQTTTGGGSNKKKA